MSQRSQRAIAGLFGKRLCILLALSFLHGSASFGADLAVSQPLFIGDEDVLGFGQSFIAAENASMTRLRLHISASSGGTDITVHVYRFDRTHLRLDSTELGSSVLTEAQLSTTAKWVDIVFRQPIPLEANQAYSFTVENKDPGGITGWNNYGVTLTDVYCCGEFFFVRNGQVTTNTNVKELAFEVVTSLGPVIIEQPKDEEVAFGEDAQFSIEAAGKDKLTFRWQGRTSSSPDFVDLQDGTEFQDVTTRVLKVLNANAAMNGSAYRCLVGDATVYTATSNAATLTLPDDSDCDLIPDQWEMDHLNSLTVAGEDSDLDGDGYSDREECLRGFDPLTRNAAPIQADLSIGFGSKRMVGARIYDRFAGQQSISTVMRPGTSKTCLVQIQNKGNAVGNFRLLVPAVNSHCGFRYYIDGMDVTKRVRLGTFKFASLRPGERRTLEVMIFVRSNALSGEQCNLLLETRSDTDNEARDGVNVGVQVR